MSLPACEERVLHRIETALQAGEPGLTSMFAIFTSLAVDDGQPLTEGLGRRLRRPWCCLARAFDARWRKPAFRRRRARRRSAKRRPATRLRRIAVIAVALTATGSGVFLGVSAATARACGQSSAARSSAHPVKCRSPVPIPARGRGPLSYHGPAITTTR